MPISLKKRIVLFAILVVISLFLFSFLSVYLYTYTVDTAVTPENVFTGSLEPTGEPLELRINNTRDGSFWVVPNTYTLDFETELSMEIGIVLIFGDDYDPREVYPSFEEAQNATDKTTTLSVVGEDPTRGPLSLNQNGTGNQLNIDIPNGQDFFVLVLYALDLDFPNFVSIDIAKQVYSELSFPYTSYILITLLLLQLGFLFASFFPASKEPESGFSKAYAGIQQSMIHVAIVIVLLLSFYSRNYLENEFIQFWNILLLFFGFYKINAMEEIFGFKIGRGFNALSSMYLTSLVTYSAIRNSHFSISEANRTISYLVYLGIDFVSPLFWIILFYLVTSVLAKVQKLINNGKDGLLDKIIRYLLGIFFVISLEISLEFYGFIEFFVTNTIATSSFSSQVLDIIAYIWILHYGIKIIKRVLSLMQSRKEEMSIHPLANMLKFPEFTEIKVGITSISSLTFMFYNIYLFFIWISDLNARISTILQDFGNFSIIELIDEGLISDLLLAFAVSIMYFINFFLLWNTGFKLGSLSMNDADQRFAKAYLFSFMLLHLNLFLTWVFYGSSPWDYAQGNDLIIFQSVELLVFLLVLLLFRIKHDPETRISKLGGITNWTFILIANVFLALLYTSYLEFVFAFIFALFLIFIAGYILVTITNILQSFVQDNYENSKPGFLKYLSDIIMAILGFLYYLLLDPLGLEVALRYFIGFLIFVLITYSWIKKVITIDYPESQSLVLASLKRAIGILVFIFGYSYFYLYDIEYSLGDPFEYLMLGFVFLIDVISIYILTMPLQDTQPNS